MGKAFVIKEVSFQSVALDHVTFVDSVPCTGLTLSEDSVSFEYLGDTVSVTATPTPADTTDQIVWSSSNENVASVSNGIITLNGLGTTTITATCGTITASIAVLQSSAKVNNYYKLASTMCAKRSNDAPNMVIYGSASFDICCQQYDANNNYVHVQGGDERGLQSVLVPYGAASVSITTSASTAPTFKCEVGDPVNRTVGADGVYYPTYINSSASYLSSQSVTPGRVIAIRLSHNAETLEAITGILFSAA